MARLFTFVLFLAVCLALVAAKCNTACTDDYTPVCGMNKNGVYKTYSNLCEFEIEKCQNPTDGWYVKRSGACN